MLKINHQGAKTIPFKTISEKNKISRNKLSQGDKILWPPDVKSQLFGKYPDSRKF